MPIYKQRPQTRKKTENLPFYRPIDRLVLWASKNRKKIGPLLIAILAVLVVFGAFKAYSARYEGRAAELLNRGESELLVKEYGRSKAAPVARLRLGKIALDSGEYDRAVDWYLPVASNTSAPAQLRIAAQQNLALAYLKKEDSAKAVTLLEQAARDPQNATKDYTERLLAHARGTNEWPEPETKPVAPPASGPSR